MWKQVWFASFKFCICSVAQNWKYTLLPAVHTFQVNKPPTASETNSVLGQQCTLWLFDWFGVDGRIHDQLCWSNLLTHESFGSTVQMYKHWKLHNTSKLKHPPTSSPIRVFQTLSCPDPAFASAKKRRKLHHKGPVKLRCSPCAVCTASIFFGLPWEQRQNKTIHPSHGSRQSYSHGAGLISDLCSCVIEC